MRSVWMGRLLAMVAVGAALMWALGAVRDVVNERTARQQEAEQSVAASLAGEQTLVGPWLVRDCVERYRTLQGDGHDALWRDEQRTFTVQAAPTRLDTHAQAGVEARTRGIFKVNGYVLTAQVQAHWDDLAALDPAPVHERGRVSCEPARWVVALADPRGIREAVLTVQGQPVAIDAGTQVAAHRRGMSAVVPGFDPGHTLQATLKLTLAGTRRLAFAPVAAANTVRLEADWPHPSFDGRFLPTQRQVKEGRLDATWQVSALASTARENLLASHNLCGGAPGNEYGTAPPPEADGCVESFGVAFIDPVNPYVLSDRATKYGLLFIVLTFVAVGLVQVLQRLAVHPMQYLLVGAALVVFFLLLVSLSETWAFGAAYATAATACTALLAFYGSHVLGGAARGLAMGAGVALLYGVLYLLLRLEQGSLLMGSLLLFAVLAAVMALTRRVDWYRVGASMSQRAPEPAVATQPGQEAV